MSPDSETVVFPLRERNNGKLHPYSVAIGSSTLVDLIDDTSEIDGFRFGIDNSFSGFSKDDSRILYTTLAEPSFNQALFSIPAAGGIVLPLSPTPTGTDNGSSSYIFTPDGTRVVYRFKDSSSAPNKILSADIVTGEIKVLAEPPSSGNFVSVLTQSGDVMYSVRKANSDNYRFFSTASDGTGAPTPLFSGAAIGPSVKNFVLSPDEKTLVWSYDEPVASRFKHEIKSASLNSSDISLVNSVIDDKETDFDPDFYIGADSSRVVFKNEDSNSPSYGYFAVPIAGGDPERIDDTDRLYGQYEITKSGDYVIFTARETGLGLGEAQLFSAKLSNESAGSDICFPIKAQNNSVSVICL